ncbi:zinc finger protein RFP-like [Podarcis muralis]
MAETPRKRLRFEATCPVCLAYFADPVTLDCGHNFCQGCISTCWEEAGTETRCPQCRAAVGRDFKSNRSLASIVEIAQQLNSMGLEGPKCVTHKAPMNLFCKDHEIFFCLLCDAAQQHPCKAVVPIDQAVEEYKDRIFRCLEVLKEGRETILQYTENLENESQDLLELMKEEKGKIVAEFGKLCQSLRDQEKLLLQDMVNVEKCLAVIKKSCLSRFSEELASLGGFIQDMEEVRQKPEIEFLQEAKSILQRYDKKKQFENPFFFYTVLKWRIEEFRDRNVCLNSIVQELRGGLTGLNAATETITLDPKTASPQLIMSRDFKSVRHGGKDPDLSTNPERIYDDWPFVMGSQALRGGRYTWQVFLGSEGDWAVGVSQKNGSSTPRRNEIWQVGKWDGEHWASCPSCYRDHSLPFSEEIQRIRVVLNCRVGQLVFYDADSGAELTEFKDVNFGGRDAFPFFRLSEKGYIALIS